MPVQCTCLVCGKVRLRPASRPTPYCSGDCYHIARRLPAAQAILSDDGLTARIPLHAQDGSVKAYALIDAADAAWVSQWRWWPGPKGGAMRKELIDGRRRSVLLHRELMGLAFGDEREVDHISRDRNDNRRSNLRIVPSSVQVQNRSNFRGSASEHRGVTWRRDTGKWYARVQVNGVRRLIGSFASETEAGEAARAARASLLPFAID